MPDGQSAGGRDPLQQMIIDEIRTTRAEQNQRLDQMRIEFNARLDRLVTTEAFAAEQRRVDDRFAAQGEDIVGEASARKADIKALRDAADKTQANLRWVAAAIVLPVALFVANLVLIRGGV